MLVEFRVKNFRSLRDEQVFSLVASTDKTLLETHATATGLKTAPHVLRTAAIYGANASGKSNLIKAIQFMRGVVVESATLVQPGQTYDRLQSFRLDNRTVDEPTEFEMTFLIDGVRYQYGFAMTQKRIVEEYLYVYKSAKAQMWFEREFDSIKSEEKYRYGNHLKGDRKLWERSTRENALLLSVAAQLNSSMLDTIYRWFLNHLIIINEQSILNPKFTIEKIENENVKAKVKNFLVSADITIDDIEIEKNSSVFFWHRTEHGDAKFNLLDESSGTQVFFNLSCPLFEVLDKGQIFVVDELELHLHPKLVIEIINQFYKCDAISGNAQLIFATHNVALLEVSGLFRRDQIWLVDKDFNQTSSLVPLSDFSLRKGELNVRNYMKGRYGGIPFIPNGLSLSADVKTNGSDVSLYEKAGA
jgi:AAA15 family ATPase/GTPase